MAERATHIMSVDVEDWFHILETDESPRRSDWDGLESRVERNTDQLLELFEETGSKSTFFLVGWVAARQPALVRRIADAGHELGSHSYWHEVLGNYDRPALAADVERSRKVLEDLSGTAVQGFRAPGSSITEQTVWALDVIAEQGFRYDSSLCPGYSSHGGFHSPFKGPHRLRCPHGELVEIPTSTIGLGARRIPYAGGGYLRLFPYSLIRAAFAHDTRRGRPANVYLHPREIDPGQPRMSLSALRRFKYYVGISGHLDKLRRLLRDHRFVSAAQWIDENEASLADRMLDLRAPIADAVPGPDPARIPPLPTGEPLPERVR